MRYTVDETTFAISIFDDGADVPFQFQPTYPNGDSFDSIEEAGFWAELSIAAHSPDVSLYAPNGKNLEPESKPTPSETKAHALKKLGLSVDDLKELLGLI